MSDSFPIPTEWTFRSEAVAQGFDRHVREQLPWYDLATIITAHVARHYIPENGRVYDIGASTGNIGLAMAETLSARKAEFIPIDNAAEMAAQYRGPGEIITCDALEFDFKPFDFAACFLVMMFMPVASRTAWLARLCAQLKPGGAILVFDKGEPQKGYIASVLSRLTLAGKLAQGVNPTEILSKELSLAGVQRPIDWQATLPLHAVEIFRFGDFAGWLIEPAK